MSRRSKNDWNQIWFGLILVLGVVGLIVGSNPPALLVISLAAFGFSNSLKD